MAASPNNAEIYRVCKLLLCDGICDSPTYKLRSNPLIMKMRVEADSKETTHGQLGEIQLSETSNHQLLIYAPVSSSTPLPGLV